VGTYATALCDAFGMAAAKRLGVLSLNRAGEITYLLHADHVS
jgi:hypothetical protein